MNDEQKNNDAASGAAQSIASLMPMTEATRPLEALPAIPPPEGGPLPPVLAGVFDALRQLKLALDEMGYWSNIETNAQHVEFGGEKLTTPFRLAILEPRSTKAVAPLYAYVGVASTSADHDHWKKNPNATDHMRIYTSYPNAFELRACERLGKADKAASAADTVKQRLYDQLVSTIQEMVKPIPA